jgi:NAD(P)-dependent dehydrogenase (short-subunit alcohol dehydrogenase family)
MAGTAVIIGASGGIGAALADALEEEGHFSQVLRFARTLPAPFALDITDEASVRAAAELVQSKLAGKPLELVIVATGLLHDGERGPEKANARLDPDWMLRNFAVNSVGPAIVAKHFMPLLPRDERSIFAALSARVGSISDNRMGGWHSYRAAKAALNQLIRTMSIELARTHKRSICVTLHPGTVDTGLSKPFQSNVPAGQLFSADRAAVQLLDVLDGLRPVDSGKCFAWDGVEIAP